MDHPSGHGPWRSALEAPDDLLGVGTGAGTFAARLDGWLADARTDDSALARSKERWLRTAAGADASLIGVLMDLAERGVAVSVATSHGRRHHGTIQVLGADFIAIRLAHQGDLLLPLSGVASVQTAPLVEAALGERVVTTDLRLGDVMSELAGERARVLLVVGDGSHSVAGEVRSVGTDVITLHLDADPGASAYVPLRALVEVLV